MPSLTHAGLRLHYEIHGTGTPVILLHGATVSFAFNYAGTGWIEPLTARGLQVIGLDFRGHGKSDKPHDAAAYGTAILADDVLALMDHLQLERAALLGYSIGTAVALHLTHTVPARITRAALVATGDGLIGHKPHEFARIMPPLGPLTERTAFPTDMPPHLAAYWTLIERTGGDRVAMKALSGGAYPHLTAEQAANIAAPVLVVSGALDSVTGRGPRVAAALGYGRYHEVPGGDHFSLAADAGVQAMVAQFIAVVPTAG